MSIEVDVGRRLGAFSLRARFRSEGHLTALFGRSGAGKTTLVNIIAGLLKPDQGRVVVNGQVLVDTGSGVYLPTHRRRIGYVFQESRLFPHLTVRHNLLYGHWLSPRAARRARLGHVAELLGIGELLNRRPGRLSGGETQRVAIGRALLANPRLLLMDEPLAALDEARKMEILPYIERLRDETRIPIVYVSHSVPEVARLASTVVLLSDGAVADTGPAASIMGRLDLLPMTGRYEAGAILDTRIAGHEAEAGLTRLRCAAGELRVPRIDLPPETPVRVRIRARDVMIASRRPEGLSALNVLPGRILDISAGPGPITELSLDLGGDRILARITRQAISNLGLEQGQNVYAVIKSIAFDRHTMAPQRPVGGFEESGEI